MTDSTSLATHLAAILLLGLFFGLAFEEFYRNAGQQRPGGIRTFPLLALAGGMLYQLDPTHFVPFTAGLVVLGAWLFAYYRNQVTMSAAKDGSNAGLMVPVCNVHAYLLGAVALALPIWVAIGVTVATVLLLTGRERLHALAREVETAEIVTAAQFLILTGLVLPLLPNEPVTVLTAITPRQVWLALLAVCTVSYASYLLQRILHPAEGDLWMAFLGGLYSSTATTVVLARRAKSNPELIPQVRAGITLATSIMYVRLLVIVGVFNRPLAWTLAPALLGLCIAGLICATLQYRLAAGAAHPASAGAPVPPRNPLELGSAALFAALYVIISLVSTWAGERFGRSGVDVLAALVGVSDIDPFVLNLAQGGAGQLPVAALASAILIAASSNNLLKASYTAIFAGRQASLPPVATLTFLSVVGAGLAFLIGGM